MKSTKSPNAVVGDKLVGPNATVMGVHALELLLLSRFSYHFRIVVPQIFVAAGY